MHRCGHGEGVAGTSDIAHRGVITRSVAVEVERRAMSGLARRPASAAKHRYRLVAAERRRGRARPFDKSPSRHQRGIGVRGRRTSGTRIAAGGDTGRQAGIDRRTRPGIAYGIDPGTTDKRIRTGTADQHIIAIATEQDVVTTRASELVIARSAAKRVDIAVARQEVGKVAAGYILDPGDLVVGSIAAPRLGRGIAVNRQVDRDAAPAAGA